VVSGVVVKETQTEIQIIGNLLSPKVVTRLPKKAVEERFPSKVSAMPLGMADTLTRPEILDLMSYLATGFQLPEHLKHKHGPHKK
jgi:hypothetical protein